jgi:hypothetical protein
MMGKGKPAPRETAKEKKSSAQKAPPAKASGKKTVAPQSKAASAPKKAQKPEPQKSEGAAGKPTAKPTAKAESAPPPGPQSKTPAAASPVKQPEPAAARQAPQPVASSALEHDVHKQAAQASSAPAVQPSDRAQAAGSEELEGVRLPAAAGKVGVFGGPRDRSVKPDDKLSLPTGRHYQFEQFRTLNPKSFYCAMRWEYRQQHMSTEEGKRWWANKKIAVTNPANNKTVVVRAVDYGPHESTGLAIAISPGAAEALGVEAGHEVLIAFADDKAQIGPVTAPAGAD